jgi:hypothetical protein
MSSEQRTAIYGAFAAVLAALGVFGVITAEESTAYGAAGLEILAAASSLMSAVKTWKQRGESAKIALRFDGTNAENAEAFTRALRELQGRSNSI